MTSVVGPSVDRRRVGVVVTTVGDHRHLAEALASVVAQQRPPERLVVVDDGSSHPEAAVSAVDAARAGLDRTDVHVVHQPNRGQLGAIRAGLAGVGDIDVVALLDGDDRWRPDHLARSVGPFETERLLDVLYATCTYLGGEDDGSPVEPLAPGVLRDDWLRSVYAYAWPGVPTSGIVLRRDVAAVLLDGDEAAASWRLFADDLIVVGSAARQLRRRASEHATVEYRVHGDGGYSGQASADRSRLLRTLRVEEITGVARRRWRSLSRAERRMVVSLEVAAIERLAPDERRAALRSVLRSVPLTTSERAVVVAGLVRARAGR